MSEWWTYTIWDFLLFSPRTYYRLFEIYNAAIWPAQIAAGGLGVAILLLWRSRMPERGRAVVAILAACWLWVAVVFLGARYATINWAAAYFAWGFGLESALLLGVGILARPRTLESPVDRAGRTGFGMFLFALAAEPLVGPILGRGWRAVEIFGVAPDPTAIATLGTLLLVRVRGRWLLFILPAIWCALSGATLMAMKSPDAWIPPLAAVVAIVGAVRQARARRRRNGTTPSTPIGTPARASGS